MGPVRDDGPRRQERQSAPCAEAMLWEEATPAVFPPTRSMPRANEVWRFATEKDILDSISQAAPMRSAGCKEVRTRE